MSQLVAEPPRKLFYRIQEVSQLAGVKPHVLRYWETEFPMLSPQKGSNDQRRYRAADIDLVQRIKQLLYEEKFTIAGARKRLEDEAHGNGHGGNGNGNGKSARPAESVAAKRTRLSGNGKPKIDRIARRLGHLREELVALQAFLAS